ncbi:MAG TPA: protocatechuate 3,4-dioxygenase subunit alpha [Candidatus Acidoferrales bacterium]|nr:protocatechuate 3,4-dioxygenase subunit alpha [Candidatus Acidoferrales bacterium]
MSRPPNTPSQTAGPFFSLGLTWDGAENLVSPEDPRAILVEGLVLDGAGQPVPDALLEIWQADEEGQFPPDSRPNWPGFGRSITDEEGAFHFFTIKPGRVTSADGTLAAPHIQVQVFGRGLLRQLSTRIYFPDEAAANLTDPALGAIPDERARQTLVAGATSSGVRFDVVLQGEGETVFFGP